MADDIEGIIRIGFMLKRSQNKRKLAPVNYKSRVFILTQNELIYFEGTLEVCVLILLKVCLLIEGKIAS